MVHVYPEDVLNLAMKSKTSCLHIFWHHSIPTDCNASTCERKFEQNYSLLAMYSAFAEMSDMLRLYSHLQHTGPSLTQL